MALLSYLYGITSERRLIQEIRLSLAYLWFIGYDLDESVPDHSVLSKARKRYGPTVYPAFFKEVVRQCEQAGLIRGDKLYADSTLVLANASLDSVGSRALISQLPEIPAHVDMLWADNPETSAAEDSATESPADVPAETASRSLTLVPLSTPNLPSLDESSRPTAGQTERPSTLAPDVLAPPVPAPLVPAPVEPSPGQAPAPHAPAAPRLHLASSKDPPNKPIDLFNSRVVSRVDPEAEVVTRPSVVLDLYYKVHAVGAGRARIVTAVEVTGGAIADDHLLNRLVSEHDGNVGCLVKEVGADTKYGTVANYRYLEARGIRAAIPMADRRPSCLPTDAFVYEPKRDRYLCPGGKMLLRHGVISTEAGLPIAIYGAKP